MVHPSFREAVRFWLLLGFISFGGPTGQIAIMHTELVEKRRWISESRFLHALNFCMFLPGPEAQQLATYIGWLLHKTRGALAAGILFFLPSVLLLWALSYTYAVYGRLAIFYGIKTAVVAIIAMAVINIGKRVLRAKILYAIAGAAFLLTTLQLPFPLVIAFAGLAGWLLGNYLPSQPAEEPLPPHTKPTVRRALKISAIFLTIWWLPVLAVGLWRGWHSTLFQEGIFFSKTSLLSFGGAYAALAYVSQQAVSSFKWLTADQMIDGLGLAETTPGPLIIVVLFVGFLGGWHNPEGLSPILAATIGTLIATWTTFIPSLFWIFLGAPYVEQLRSNRAFTSVVTAITAAVVGVILNLALWFAGHVFFPDADGLDLKAAAMAIAAFIGLFRWGIIPIILGSCLVGYLL